MSVHLRQDQCHLLRTFLPMWLYVVSLNLNLISTSYFAQFIGPNYLAGVGLGQTVNLNFLWNIMQGFGCVFETFGPQIYGSKLKKELGTLLLKTLLQGLLIYLVVLGPYLNSVYLVSLFKAAHENGTGCVAGSGGAACQLGVLEKELDVQEIAIYFIRAYSLVTLMDYIIEMFFKYFVNQKYQRAVYVIAGCLTCCHLAYSYLFVVVLGLGLEGLVGAGICGRATTLLLTLAFFCCKRREMLWAGVTRRVLLNWGDMMKLGVPSAVKLFVGYGFFAFTVIIAQVNGPTTVESLVILNRIECIFYPGAIAMTYSLAVLVGNELGTRNADKVRFYLKLVLCNAVVERSLAAGLCYLLTQYLPPFFTSKEEVIRAANKAGIVFTVMIFLENFEEVLGRGVLMVFGKQRFVLVSSLLASYGVGLPVLLYVVYRTELQTGGIVLAVVLEKLVQVLAYSFRSARIDIEQEIAECHDRLQKGFQGSRSEMYGTIQHSEEGGEEEGEYKSSLRNIIISFFLATISLAVFGTVSFMF